MKYFRSLGMLRLIKIDMFLCLTLLSFLDIIMIFKLYSNFNKNKTIKIRYIHK
jgi:hypothetical protein